MKISGYVVTDKEGRCLNHSFKWVCPSSPGPSGQRTFVHDLRDLLEGEGDWIQEAMWVHRAEYSPESDYLQRSDDDPIPFEALLHLKNC